MRLAFCVRVLHHLYVYRRERYMAHYVMMLCIRPSVPLSSCGMVVMFMILASGFIYLNCWEIIRLKWQSLITPCAYRTHTHAINIYQLWISGLINPDDSLIFNDNLLHKYWQEVKQLAIKWLTRKIGIPDTGSCWGCILCRMARFDNTNVFKYQVS